jgi:hypothetical protein
MMVSAVGTSLSLPFEVEPYGPGGSQYAAEQRLLERAISKLSARFADYVVVDGGFATATLLHRVGEMGLKVTGRLKANRPEFYEAAQQRFCSKSSNQTFRDGADRVEIWDADDFDPWMTLRWDTVRVIHYRLGPI